MPIKAGTLVEFMQDNAPTIGYVLEDQGGRIRLLLANRREINLTQARLLPWTGPSITAKAKEDIITALNEHKEKRLQIQAAINIQELWDMTQGEVSEESAEFFAGLMENELTPDIVSAYAHALLECKSRFKFQNPNFEVYDQETVDAKILAEKQQKERTALISGGSEWFKFLWDLACRHHTISEKDSLKEPEEPVAGTLKNLLFKHMAETESHEENLLWKQVSKQIPDEPHIAYQLACAWKLVPEHYNFWLLKADYDETERFADPFAEEIGTMQNLSKIISEMPFEDSALPLLNPEQGIFKNSLHAGLDDEKILCGVFGKVLDLPFVSIDSASTKDIDDAFYFRENPDASKEIYIALACPAFFWQFGSELDKTIAKRCTSIYLPEHSLHMLPESLSTNAFSLLEHQIKPAMVIKAVYGKENTLIEASLEFCRIKVQDNLQYLACEQFLTDKDDAELSMENILNADCSSAKSYYAAEEEKYAPSQEALAKAERYLDMLQKAHAFTKAHLEKRIENGAVIIERDEYDLYLEGEDRQTRVFIEPMPQSPKAQLIVSEFMVIANAICADFAVQNNINLLFRTQNAGMPKEMAGIWKKPEEIAKVARLLSPAITEIEAKPHTGLGLKAYSPVTSPLRRYGDLVNQAQLMHFHFFQRPLFGTEEMEQMLLNYNVHNGLAGQVQRNRPRYWRFVFMQQEAKRQGEKCGFHGIISDENDMYVTVSLTREQILVRAKRQLFGDKALLGQEVLLRLGKINPLLFEVSIMKVQEI